MRSVLILGGYGTFGHRISISLAKADIPIIIAGRSLQAANKLKESIKQQYSPAKITTAVLDINDDFDPHLERLQPFIVIHTCGPFQRRDYSIAKACIQNKVHYIDLADGRDFVTQFSQLNAQAEQAGVHAITGASTVPGLSSAVIEHFRSSFSNIDRLRYGITPGQKAPRGLATTQSILSYLGKPIITQAKTTRPRYGWQQLYRQAYPVIGKRWMASCDIPDLDLFPSYYDIKQIEFSAGMESTCMHLAIWLCSWLPRMQINIPFARYAKTLLKASRWLDLFGSNHGGMHMTLTGNNHQGRTHTINWFILGFNGDGPQIPCVPAIVLTKKILAGNLPHPGAQACLGLITLKEYLAELESFHVQTVTDPGESKTAAEP